jgi:hypothetical protein
MGFPVAGTLVVSGNAALSRLPAFDVRSRFEGLILRHLHDPVAPFVFG